MPRRKAVFNARGSGKGWYRLYYDEEEDVWIYEAVDQDEYKIDNLEYIDDFDGEWRLYADDLDEDEQYLISVKAKKISEVYCLEDEEDEPNKPAAIANYDPNILERPVVIGLIIVLSLMIYFWPK